MDYSNLPFKSNPKPCSRLGPKTKATLAKKRRKIYLANSIRPSSTSTNELDSDSNASTCSTIYVGAPGSHSSHVPSPTSSGPPSTTPVPPTPNRVTSACGKANRRAQSITPDIPKPSSSHWRSLRTHRICVFLIMFSVGNGPVGLWVD